MAYIGNTVQTQSFAPAIDYFNGNGVTVTFTLSRPIASVAQLIVSIENVIQNPSSAFTVSGNSITFTSAPPSGTNNIWVEYTSLITTYAAISQDPSVVGDITASGGFSSTGDYGNSFADGVIMDYVTGEARITTGPADAITLYNGGTSARSALMTLSAAGNVGIGISSPSSKLHVKNGSNGIEVYPSGTWAGQVYNANDASGSNGLVVGNRWAADTSTVFEAGSIYGNGSGSWSSYYKITGVGTHIWGSGGAGTERMRIDGSGNLLVGITSVSANNSKSMFFDVQQGYQSIQHSTANTSGNYFIGFAYNGSYIGNIAQNGTTATSYNTSSDYRLKENIAPMTGALATVAQLKPVTYNWKADGCSGQGFIAHELQAVVPDCVTGEKDAVDAEGNPVYQGIDTSFLVATLTAAIQEQQEIINDLKARIETLESK